MSVLFGDTLVDTDGVALPAHTPTGANAGLSWQRGPNAANDLIIVGNGVVCGTAGFVENIFALFNQSGSWPTDYSVAFDMHFLTNVNNNFPAVCVRHVAGSDQCYFAQYDSSTGWGVGIVNTGTPGLFTEIDSFAYTYPGNDVTDHMVFEVQGTTLRLKKNGVTIITVTDATISAAGKPALYSLCGTVLTASTGFHIENVVISDFSGGGGQAPAEHDAYFPIAAPAPGPNLLFY